MWHHHHQRNPEGGRCGSANREHFQQHFARFGGMRGGGPERGGPFAARGFGHGGGGRERMFETGEFQLVLLHLLAEKPSYGYQLIKTLEERFAGAYAPSPGVVYPTLTMLEEEGLTTAGEAEGGRKVYTVTESGRQHLEANKQRVAEIFDRVEETGQGFEGGRSPEFRRAFKNLQRAIFSVAMRARLTRKPLTPEQIHKIVDAVEAAAKVIDSL